MIKDLVLVEFNDSVGKRIICSARALLSDQQFKNYDQVLLPKDQLCLRFISLKLKDLFLATIPILLRSSAYKRQKYLFAPILIFHQHSYQQYQHYVYLLAHKISSIYANIEIEEQIVIDNKLEVLQAITDQLFEKVNHASLTCFRYNNCLAFFNYQPLAAPLVVQPQAVLSARETDPLLQPSQGKGLVTDLIQKGYCSLHKIAQANESNCQDILKMIAPKLRSKQIMQHGFFDLQNRFQLTPTLFTSTLMETFDPRPFCKRPIQNAKQIIRNFFLQLNKNVTIGTVLKHQSRVADILVVKLIRWAVQQQIIRPVQDFFIPERNYDVRKKLEEYIGQQRKDYKDEKICEQKVSRLQKLIRDGVWISRLCSQLEMSKKKCLQLVGEMEGLLLLF